MRRKAIGMSQTELADAIDVTFRQVSKYEAGTDRIGASRLVQIARALGVPVTFFFEDAPAANSGQGKRRRVPRFDLSDFLDTAEGFALSQAFMAMDDRRIRRSFVEL